MNTGDGGRCECLLIMYTALWEDRSLVAAQLSVNLRAEAVFHDESSLELTLYNSKELVGTVMHVRYVKPARFKNGNNTGDTDGFEEREVVYGGKEDGTTIGTRRRFLVIEIEDYEFPKVIASKKVSAAVCQQLCQLVDVAGLGHEPRCNLHGVGDEWDRRW